MRDFPYPLRTMPVVWEILMTILRLKREGIDVVLDLEGSALSALIGALSGCQRRMGGEGDEVGVHAYGCPAPGDRS